MSMAFPESATSIERIRPSTAGVTAGAIAAAGACGWASWHWTELLAPALFPLMMLIAGTVAAVYSVPQAPHMDLSARRTTVGGDLTIIVSPPHRHGQPSEYELPIGTRTIRLIPPTDCGSIPVSVPTDQRGIIAVGPVRVVSGDPWGLVRRHTTVGEPTTIVIHPRRIAVSGSAHARPGGATTSGPSSGDDEFRTLGPYDAGDAAHDIHWRSSARMGTLMVRRYTIHRDASPLFVLDTNASHYRLAEDFELAVCLYASLGVDECRQTLGVTTGTDGVIRRYVTPVDFLDHCAGVSAHATPAKPPAADAGIGPLRLITGNLGKPPGIRRHDTGAGPRPLIIRADTEARDTIRCDTGVITMTVSRLASLPGMVGTAFR